MSASRSLAYSICISSWKQHSPGFLYQQYISPQAQGLISRALEYNNSTSYPPSFIPSRKGVRTLAVFPFSIRGLPLIAIALLIGSSFCRCVKLIQGIR